jgi:coenzyme PQQ precursor peptide PqqA
MAEDHRVIRQKGSGPEHVVGMHVRLNQIGNRAICHLPDRLAQPAAPEEAAAAVDHSDTLRADDKPDIGNRAEIRGSGLGVDALGYVDARRDLSKRQGRVPRRLALRADRRQAAQERRSPAAAHGAPGKFSAEVPAGSMCGRFCVHAARIFSEAGFGTIPGLLTIVAAATSLDRLSGATGSEENTMVWKTPRIVEISVGMEINSYACAEIE